MMKLWKVWLVYLVLALIALWSMTALKLVWSPVEVDVWMDEDGSVLFSNQDGTLADRVVVNLDSRYVTVRNSMIFTFGIVFVILLTISWVRIETDLIKGA